ncbi:GH3 auxin-responsive promoter family protein [Cytophagales bacterium LB-30]|uniref:GH3 auxin-responsive promoter family protein n=1 Tax=Shiella aurantiaca TaxID=3058365 RepID=A0ABT8F8G7_9BACT|nr:GH3 auxin-responsive promoter family protein [Shiella aurantiaca]MDN4166782.1 GH3 auxin-responsive promoter family protein [Shiella aurantiaca]
MKKRIHEVELFIKYPHEVQTEVFFNLIDTAKDTEFGKKYEFSTITSLDKFRERVPIHSYNDLYPYIKRLMEGEQNVLWPTEITWFAKSSGTTSASKFIPVSNEALEECHFKGGKDLLSIYLNNNPNSNLFTGKLLSIGGSHQINTLDKSSKSQYGDVSAVIMKNLPFWAQLNRTPSLETALMDEWEAKIEKMAHETLAENVTGMAGVPTWTIVLINRIMELKGAKNILEVWPNLELFIHGAVSFTPYRDLFKKLVPSDSMNYLETYNATEGFFGIQDLPQSEEMLLMLDYGIYYEFIAAEEANSENPKVYSLEEVELNKSYALLITTNAGLWRYMIGDTVKFTNLSPYRIKITGRTKHFINAFGEELSIENAEIGISKACQETDASINNFTAGPKYFGEGSNGCHEWIIEFAKEPNQMEVFVQELDQALRKSNSDYDAKRYKDIALSLPTVHMAPEGTFHKWLKSKGKLGGQNKVPRLANNREYLEELLQIIKGH